jgi:hypothetical protein
MPAEEIVGIVYTPVLARLDRLSQRMKIGENI